MAMAFRRDVDLRQLTSSDFGIEATGIDISKPLAPTVASALRQAFEKYRVLVIRGQSLSRGAYRVQPELRRARDPCAERVSQGGASGDLRAFQHRAGWEAEAVHPDRGTLFWHTDASFQSKPALATILYAEQVPSNGGHTMFADMIGAYEALGQAERQRYLGLRVRHDLHISRLKAGYPGITEAQRKQAPPVVQPLVRLHEPTGRKAVYLGSHGQEFLDMDEVESRGLIERVMNHCTEPRFIYEHRWKAGDLVMWDNRASVHRGTEYDTAIEPRVVRRTVIKGTAPIAAT